MVSYDIDMKGIRQMRPVLRSMKVYDFLLDRLRLVLARIEFKRWVRLLSASGYSSRKRLSLRPSLDNLYSGQ